MDAAVAGRGGLAAATNWAVRLVAWVSESFQGLKYVKRVEMKRVCYFISRSFAGKIAERKCESKTTKM